MKSKTKKDVAYCSLSDKSSHQAVTTEQFEDPACGERSQSAQLLSSLLVFNQQATPKKTSQSEPRAKHLVYRGGHSHVQI